MAKGKAGDRPTRLSPPLDFFRGDADYDAFLEATVRISNTPLPTYPTAKFATMFPEGYVEYAHNSRVLG